MKWQPSEPRPEGLSVFWKKMGRCSIQKKIWQGAVLKKQWEGEWSTWRWKFCSSISDKMSQTTTTTRSRDWNFLFHFCYYFILLLFLPSCLVFVVKFLSLTKLRRKSKFDHFWSIVRFLKIVFVTKNFSPGVARHPPVWTQKSRGGGAFKLGPPFW